MLLDLQLYLPTLATSATQSTVVMSSTYENEGVDDIETVGNMMSFYSESDGLPFLWGKLVEKNHSDDIMEHLFSVDREDLQLHFLSSLVYSYGKYTRVYYRKALTAFYADYSEQGRPIILSPSDMLIEVMGKASDIPKMLTFAREYGHQATGPRADQILETYAEVFNQKRWLKECRAVLTQESEQFPSPALATLLEQMQRVDIYQWCGRHDKYLADIAAFIRKHSAPHFAKLVANRQPAAGTSILESTEHDLPVLSIVEYLDKWLPPEFLLVCDPTMDKVFVRAWDWEHRYNVHMDILHMTAPYGTDIVSDFPMSTPDKSKVREFYALLRPALKKYDRVNIYRTSRDVLYFTMERTGEAAKSFYLELPLWVVLSPSLTITA